jgi:hypothetical protein
MPPYPHDFWKRTAHMKPFMVGTGRCTWFYAIIPRRCMGLRGSWYKEIGRHRGWLIKRRCWHGETWYQLPEELREFWGRKL